MNKLEAANVGAFNPLYEVYCIYKIINKGNVCKQKLRCL